MNFRSSGWVLSLHLHFLLLLLLLVAFGREVGGISESPVMRIRETEERIRLGLYTDPLLFDDEDLSYLEGSGSGDGVPIDSLSGAISFNLADLHNLAGDLNDDLDDGVEDLKGEVFPAIDEFQARMENASQLMSSRLECTFSRRIQESMKILEKIFTLSPAAISEIKTQVENISIIEPIDPETVSPPEPTTLQPEDLPRDCAEALLIGSPTGVTTIQPDQRKPVFKNVWCDQDTDGGGWTVILNRQPQDVQLNFRRKFETYVSGFGNADGENWIGLEAMHQLTKRGANKLLVEMSNDNETASSSYDKFRVGPNWRQYRLKVGDFNEENSTAGEALEYHNGKKFTTYDQDNDGASGGNCAEWSGGGGWWYDFCYFANPTGIYTFPNNTDQADVYLEWRKWQGQHNYLTHFSMKIKPHPETA